MVFTNITTIVFDYKLKLLIATLKEELKNEISILQNVVYIHSIANAQENIRLYLLKYKNKLTNTSNKGFRKQDYFALMCCVITNIDDKLSFQDVIDEIKNNKTYHMVEYNEDEEEESFIPITKCACSHEIACSNSFIIQNTKTYCNLLVGCECVKKREILSPSEIKLARKIKREKQRQQKIIKENIKQQTAMLEYIKELHINEEKRKQDKIINEQIKRQMNIYQKWNRIIINCVKLNNNIYRDVQNHPLNILLPNVRIEEYLTTIIRNEIIRYYIK